MNTVGKFIKLICIITAFVILPTFVQATSTKGWKKVYRPKDNSEQELFKACAYGNTKYCYDYHKLYILQ
jgi:hypothetical protein